jgi:UDP-N-acetylmuramoyl-tripeptide--D-alanyl-D-alanine ligase
VHVEYFDSPAAVLREKLFLAKAVKKGGAVVLFGDDQKLKDLTFSGRTVMTFGMSTNANVRGSNPFIQYSTSDGIKKPTGISFKLDYAGNSLPINLDGVLGAAHVYPVLAAVTVGLIRGMSFSQIIKTTTDFNPPRGRMNIIDGMNGSTIIDDTYNSSPTAVESALAALGQVEGSGRKIAVLGDMMELGEYSTDQHKKMGQLVAGTLDASRGDMLVTVGQRARGIADSAIATGFPLSQIFSFDDSTTAGNELKKMIRTGDVILVKGSQSPRLERITKTLIADPTRATALLVRQESEWLAKK